MSALRTYGTRRMMLRGVAIVAALAISAVLNAALASARQPAPFGSPFAGPPSPATWFVSQWYGNTVWAHQNRTVVYGAGQGIHFGIDFTAPCGTPVLAIGDGTIFAVDGPYGSRPHNVVVRHPNGLFSLYGHLLERPRVTPGQPVRAGEPIALSGDPAGERCDAEPHLHLEVRRNEMREAINPVPLIGLDWQRATIGIRRNTNLFERDLDAPGRWTTIGEQPDITFGAPLINEFPRAWP